MEAFEIFEQGRVGFGGAERFLQLQSRLLLLDAENERLDLLALVLDGFPWKPVAQVNGKTEIVQRFLNGSGNS